MRRLLPWACALLVGCWSQQAQWSRESETEPLTRKKGESEEEALYRAGVTCMDVHERDDCAVQYFERLVEKGSRKRELVGDAMFRLVELYRRAEREEDARLLMREFWDRGMDRPNLGALPHSLQWLPADLEIVTSVDAARFRESQLSRQLEADTVAEIFSCDPETRARLEAQREARKKAREEKRAARAAELEAQGKKPPESGDRRRRPSPGQEARERADPVYEEGGCATAVALDRVDRLSWTRFSTASNPFDPLRSAALYSIKDLDAPLAAAVEAGRLTQLEDGSYQLPGLTHGETQRVRLAVVDLDQILLAGDEVMDETLANLAARESTLSPSLRELSQRVPQDVTFFTIMSPEAMRRGLDEMGAIASFLPTPDGMLFSAVTYDYAGLFIRIPTQNPLKAAALLSLIKTVLAANEEERAADPEPNAGERAIAKMDLSQTADGKALQMTTVLSPEDIDAIFRDG